MVPQLSANSVELTRWSNVNVTDESSGELVETGDHQNPHLVRLTLVALCVLLILGAVSYEFGPLFFTRRSEAALRNLIAIGDDTATVRRKLGAAGFRFLDFSRMPPTPSGPFPKQHGFFCVELRHHRSLILRTVDYIETRFYNYYDTYLINHLLWLEPSGVIRLDSDHKVYAIERNW
jgi:hypothetical protein